MTPVIRLALQRPPTRWAEHLVATAILLAVVFGIYLLMWRGWRRRGARQADLPPLPLVPNPVPGPLADAASGGVAALEGVYVGTTSAGDWLDRIVAHGLGERAGAHLELGSDGVAVHRDGSQPFLVPLAALRGLRLDRGIANTVIGEGAVVVLTWEHGGRLLDTGIRGPSPAANARWIRAVEELRSNEVAP